jgi:HlyD family secretion protein
MTAATDSSRPTVRRILVGAGLAAVVVAGYLGWRHFQTPPLPDYIVGGNGRIEATDIDIATKSGGRLLDVLVHEGDKVQAGQVLARMDTATLQADQAKAEAQVSQAQHAKETARALLAQREQAVRTAHAQVAQRQAELTLASKQLQRVQDLVRQGFVSSQQLDQAQAQVQTAKAALSAAQSQVAEAETAVTATRSQWVESDASIQADLNDTVLRAPRAGRVQVRAAQPGEVLGAGGRVLTMVDLSDVHMTFFLPETVAGRLGMGAEVRLVLDAAPQYVIPAAISFVASEAQFTPKTVETLSERQKLVFRVRARIDPDLLARYADQVKTGLPGMAYVRTRADQPWPPALQTKLPPAATAAAAAAAAESAASVASAP